MSEERLNGALVWVVIAAAIPTFLYLLRKTAPWSGPAGALATWSPSGLAFWLFTTANLVPRARSNHRWYLATFRDYPPGRRALIPGIY